MCCETHHSHARGCCEHGGADAHSHSAGHHEADGCCGHGDSGAHVADCCCTPHGFVRLFTTKRERLAELEAYRDELAKELEGVNEHLAELSDS